jgi:hypothetical protein
VLVKVGIVAFPQQVRIAPGSQPVLLRHDGRDLGKAVDNRNLPLRFCFPPCAVQHLFGGSQRNPFVLTFHQLKNALESPRRMRPGNFPQFGRGFVARTGWPTSAYSTTTLSHLISVDLFSSAIT